LVVDEDGELPLPVIDEVIKKIDYKKGVVEVELLDGLLEIKNDKKHTHRLK
jgi:ribosomal 30S subunit maturation factor RimM